MYTAERTELMSIKRSSGILLPITALPSEYGIGTIGQAAYDFIDFLAEAGQSWWQILPVGPTGCGDSPYQSFSTFAGNPYLIDLDLLCSEGLLEKGELDCVDWGGDPARVDYGKLYTNRLPVLKKAAARGLASSRSEFDDFVRNNLGWLPDHALFMAVKDHFGILPWYEWPDEGIRLRKAYALEKYRTLLKDEIELLEYIQFLFFRQWSTLRAYAREKGIGIIGDLPIYVAMDSSDVWAQPRFFLLDEKNIPTEVAGVPPDYFSVEGQLWGNPLYDYEAMKNDGYGWWIRRVDGAAKLFDALRIDHFRGFESYWAVPYGSENAKNGRWVKGPGMDLVGRLTAWFPNVQFIAEDLGTLSPEVHELLLASQLPGMKVLEFAFDPAEPSSYLPHCHCPNCVCYTGTHDNAPLAAWLDELPVGELEFAIRYLGLNEAEGFIKGIIRGGMSSVASLFISQMQDYLELGGDSRMNTPGTIGGNWQWRLTRYQLSGSLASDIAAMTSRYGRSNDSVNNTNERFC